MKKVLMILLPCFMLCVGGCRSFYDVKMQPGQLAEQLQTGDKVDLVTKDGGKHRLVIEKIENGVFYGKRDSVRVDDVVSVKRSELSPGKSLGMAAGITAYASLVLLVLAGI